MPAFPGWHAVRDALAAGVDETGCTVHVATLQMDTGPILAQQAVRVIPGDTEDSLHEASDRRIPRQLVFGQIKLYRRAQNSLQQGVMQFPRDSFPLVQAFSKPRVDIASHDKHSESNHPG